MTSDPLRDAIAAYREETGDDAPARDDLAQRRAAQTRTRIMNSLHDGKRRRISRKLFWLPMVAIFIGTSALAANAAGIDVSAFTSMLWSTDSTRTADAAGVGNASNGGELSASSGAGPEPAEPERVEPEPVEPEPAEPEPAEAEPVEPAASEPSSADAPEADSDDAAVAALASKETIAPQALPPASGPSKDAAEHVALYERAHELHFGQKNPSQALTAWEAYLAAAPTGQLATEAAYNRALCLVRLGQHARAKDALQPFASAPEGSYRQAEAAALIEAM